MAGKHTLPQWLTMDEAVVHCTQGLGIWRWASNDLDGEPDVVRACCGDTPTLEILAATSILREQLPELKIRVINVVDLMILKSNMVVAGMSCPQQERLNEVAAATVQTLLRTVPAAVAGIAFMSGGQSAEQASARLNAMNLLARSPASHLPGRWCSRSPARSSCPRWRSGEARAQTSRRRRTRSGAAPATTTPRSGANTARRWSWRDRCSGDAARPLSRAARPDRVVAVGPAHRRRRHPPDRARRGRGARAEPVSASIVC